MAAACSCRKPQANTRSDSLPFAASFQSPSLITMHESARPALYASVVFGPDISVCCNCADLRRRWLWQPRRADLGKCQRRRKVPRKVSHAGVCPQHGMELGLVSRRHAKSQGQLLTHDVCRLMHSLEATVQALSLWRAHCAVHTVCTAHHMGGGVTLHPAADSAVGAAPYSGAAAYTSSPRSCDTSRARRTSASAHPRCGVRHGRRPHQ